MAGVSLVILLGPRIVHAEEGQLLLTKNDSNIDGIKQHLADNLVKTVDAIPVSASKDVLTNARQLPIKKEVDHTVKPVHKIVDGAKKVIKEDIQHSPSSTDKAQPKGDVEKTRTIKTQKSLHTTVHQRSLLKTQIHPNLVKHHPMETSMHHQDKKDAQNQGQPLLTSNSILQPYENSNPSGNKTNNYSNGSNFLGFLDKHWLKKKIRLKEPLYFREKSGAQWENAPPSPPPEQPLHFLSFEKNQK